MTTSPLRSDKTVLAGLICFGIFAVVLGFLNLKRTIRGVMLGGRSTGGPTIATTPEEFQRRQRAILSSQDTDKDGLSDLDELERYKTSPFLADSDSDGKTDKQEIEAGTDPNCPEGKNCVEGATVNAASPAAPILPPLGAEIPAGANAGQTPPANAGNLTAAELRSALEKQGLPRSVLDQLSDAELQKSYNEMLGSLTKTPSGGVAPFGNALSQTFTSALRQGKYDPGVLLQQLPTTAPEIRKLLEVGGFPKDQLVKLDDATLLSVWQQVIADIQKQMSGSKSQAP